MMLSSDARAVLERVRVDWTEERFSRGVVFAGLDGNPVSPSANVPRMCIWGALVIARCNLVWCNRAHAGALRPASQSEAVGDAWAALCHASNERYRRSPSNVNDHLGHAAVVGLIDKVLARPSDLSISPPPWQPVILPDPKPAPEPEPEPALA